MHELNITQNMLELALSEAKKVNAGKIGRINLVIGEMSGVVDAAVEFYFGFLSHDTIAQGAVLSFKRVPMKARCRICGQEFTPEELDWTCPQCKGVSLEITSGSELYLESIEVE